MQMIRNQAVDMVRAVALFGIAVVNLPFMALPMSSMLALPEAGPDRAAVLLVELLFQAKFFLLFSFVFGWGIEIQVHSAQRAGASFARRFSRRLAMLALIGVLHAILVFSGDILVLYAGLGLVAWMARRATVRGLLWLAAGLIPVAAVSLAFLAVTFADVPLPPAEPNLGASFVEATLTRWRDWPANLLFLVLFQGHLALAAFLAGMAAARNGFFDPGNPAAMCLQKVAPALLVLGVLINLAYVSGGTLSETHPVAAVVSWSSLAIGGPVLAAAYLGLILRWEPSVRLPSLVILAGRNSLTCYVLQGVLAGFIVADYGLGLYGDLGQASLIAVAAFVALTSMALVAAFAARFGQGPLELILRRVTRS